MALNYDYILYVDEAGDPGLTRVQPIDPNGSSEWFILGGVLTRATNEALAVQWVRTIRTEIDARQGPSLHFRKLSERKRARTCELYLAKRAIKWDVVDWDLMESRLHRDVAGLQIADSLVGAFYQAVETSGSRWSPENAKRLGNVMARLSGQHRDQGVTLMPTPPWKAQLADKQKQVFRHYGYVF